MVGDNTESVKKCAVREGTQEEDTAGGKGGGRSFLTDVTLLQLKMDWAKTKSHFQQYSDGLPTPPRPIYSLHIKYRICLTKQL